MALTDAGRAFLPYAERAVRALQDGASAVERLPVTDELVLGAAPAISTYVLPDLLVRFEAAHPRVRLSVRTGHSEEILELAVRGDVDVGLVRELHHPALETLPLYDDELVLVVEPRHPLARTRRVTLDRLRDARLILFDRTSSYYDLTNALFRPAGQLPARRPGARPHRRRQADGARRASASPSCRRPRWPTSCATAGCGRSS